MNATKFKGKSRRLKTLAALKKVSPEAFQAECEQDTSDADGPAKFVLCDGFLFCLTDDYGGGFTGVWTRKGFDEVYPTLLGLDPDTEEGEEAYDDLMDRVYSLASDR